MVLPYISIMSRHRYVTLFCQANSWILLLPSSTSIPLRVLHTGFACFMHHTCTSHCLHMTSHGFSAPSQITSLPSLSHWLQPLHLRVPVPCARDMKIPGVDYLLLCHRKFSLCVLVSCLWKSIMSSFKECKNYNYLSIITAYENAILWEMMPF